jgi:hypothetical protein
MNNNKTTLSDTGKIVALRHLRAQYQPLKIKKAAIKAA